MSDYPLDPPLSLLQRLWRVSHAFEASSMRMEATLGITAQQRLVIRCVGKYPLITAGQLAVVLHVDPGTVSATLKRLEARGLLERRRDGRDRRRVVLGLTAAGRALDRPARGTLEHAAAQLLSEADPALVVHTEALLDRLAELVEQGPDAPPVARRRSAVPPRR